MLFVIFQYKLPLVPLEMPLCVYNLLDTTTVALCIAHNGRGVKEPHERTNRVVQRTGMVRDGRHRNTL